MEKHIIIEFSKADEALPTLQSIGGGHMISVQYEKPLKMVKKDRLTGEPNELHGLVETKVTVQAQTNVSYTHKKRKTDPNFQPESLDKFGQSYLDEKGSETDKVSNIVKYKTTGTKTFRIYPKTGGIKTEYFVNGKPATPEQIEIAKRNKSSVSKSDVVLMNVGLNNIKKVIADGKTLVFS